MARKKKGKYGIFEECSDVSFLPGPAAVPPPANAGLPYFSGAAREPGTEKTAAEKLVERKIAADRQSAEQERCSAPPGIAPQEEKPLFEEESAPARRKKAAASAAKAAPHYQGHRQRLRQRFLAGGRDMPDYEFLELLLFRSVPRRDTKPLAKALLAHFGNLGEVFAADIRRLREVKGCGEAAAVDLKIISAATTRILRAELLKRDVFTSWEKLIDYCRAAMAAEKREQFRILFLDKKNGLIADEILQTGTVDHTPVYPRDVVKRALELAASAIILVHNHPSGDPTPSRQDIAMTAKLRQITQAMNITIHDHLIIGRNGYSSFRALDLL